MSKVDREVDQNEEETETESDDEIEIGPDGQARSKHSRSEKKSRKALLNLGMKPVPDITRVTMKKNHNQLYVIKQPEVFKLSVDTYIIFGAVMIEDLTAKAQSAAAEQFKQPEGPQKGFSGSMIGSTYEIGDVGADDEDDETGLEPKDIELVKAQAGVPRSNAVKALRQNNGDIANAIMALTI